MNRIPELVLEHPCSFYSSILKKRKAGKIVQAVGSVIK